MYRSLTLAVLCASFLVPQAMAAQPPAYPSLTFLDSLEFLKPGQYTYDTEGTFTMMGNDALLIDATQQCTEHRNEPEAFSVRNASHCVTGMSVSGTREDGSTAKSYTTREDKDDLRIGTSSFTRHNNLDFTSYESIETYEQKSADQMRAHLGQWLRYDISVGKINNLFATGDVTERMQHQIWMVRQSQLPFAGWTQESENTWVAPEMYVDGTWSPLGFLINMEKLIVSDFINSNFEQIFLQSPVQYSGRYTVTGEQTGTVHIEGSSREYSKLVIDIEYGPQMLHTVWNATPLVKQLQTPAVSLDLLVQGSDVSFRHFTDMGITPGGQNPLTFTIESKNRVSNIRTLEDTVVAPSTALHAGEVLAPENYSCSNVQFKDICNHWSLLWLRRAQQVAYIGVMKYGDNPDYLLQPDAKIQRSEFARLITQSRVLDIMNMRIYEWPTAPYAADVPENVWYTQDVKTLLSLGVAQLQAGSKFRPNDTLNRAEVMTFLARIIEKTVQQEGLLQQRFVSWREKNPGARTVYFVDVSVDSWYAPYVLFMAEAGIVDTKQLRFRPGDAVTRAEAITLLERLRERMPNFLTTQ